MVNYQLKKMRKHHEKNCVYLIGPYAIRIEGQIENLILKSVTMIDTVTIWFKITQYYDKRAISIAKLVDTTFLTRYP